MSKGRSGGRALDRRPASSSELRVVDDPITISEGKSISVSLEKLSAPSNVYDADVAWIEHKPGIVSLFFAKRHRDVNEQLRTRLELRYPAENLVHHFWGNSREFHDMLRKFVANWPASEAPPDVRSWKSAKDHSEWVNLEAMAFAGTEATLDFYTIPAFGIARFRSGSGSAGIKVLPVVRVQLSAFELYRLMNSVEPVVSAIKEYLPQADRTTASRERSL